MSNPCICLFSLVPYQSVYDQFISLSIISSRFIHVVLYVRSFFFLGLSIFPLYTLGLFVLLLLLVFRSSLYNSDNNSYQMYAMVFFILWVAFTLLTLSFDPQNFLLHKGQFVYIFFCFALGIISKKSPLNQCS